MEWCFGTKKKRHSHNANWLPGAEGARINTNLNPDMCSDDEDDLLESVEPTKKGTEATKPDGAPDAALQTQA